MTNELTTQQTILVSETDNYTIHKNGEGKFSRRAKFLEYTSVVATTREEKIKLLNLFDGAEGTAIGLKDVVGETLEVKDIIIRKYDSIVEETGDLENGVLCYLITPEGQAYVTSAKAVYFSINRIMEVFGKPNDPEWENVKVVVTSTKMTNGDAINIKMVE